MSPTRSSTKRPAPKPAARKAPAKVADTKGASSKAATKVPAPKIAAPKAARGKAAGGMGLAETMRALEAAGSEQFRKTWRRHGASDPMFGVSFAILKTMVKKIGVDHELARALWGTGNHDARVLAIKVADPARVQPAELDRWARELRMRMCGGYLAMLAAESPHGASRAKEWLSSKDPSQRA